MGDFPEDFQVDTRRLIQLWIAEGFIRASAGSRESLEEVAEHYLEDLINRNLIMARKKRFNAQKPNFRRFSIQKYIKDGHKLLPPVARSIYCFSSLDLPFEFRIQLLPNPKIHGFFSSFNHLRVLAIFPALFRSFPLVITKLFHLRYLQVRCSGNIPESISELQNLQTLISDAYSLGMTLPRKIWMMKNLRYHFDIFVWVTISQEFRYRNVLLEALHCISKQRVIVSTKDYDKMNDSELADLVQKSLKGPRYLVVDDNIWSRDVWDSISQIFPNRNNGSQVLLTTRETDVAIYANTSSPHKMNLLDLDNNWKLLRDKVFGLEHDHPPELEEIGKKIAEKCQGLPLIISVIAGHLSKTAPKTLKSWKYVAKTLSKIIARHPNKCLGVLGLSYHHLPNRLKPCFRCFGNIPESISELLNLQTLIFDGHSSETTLPREVWMLKNLRYIRLEGATYLPSPRIDNNLVTGMPNLEELYGICYSSCTNEVISSTPNLKRLIIRVHFSILDNIPDRPLDMFSLTILETFKFYWIMYLEDPIKIFVFPESLRRVSLTRCYKFIWEEISSTFIMLPHLEELKLKHCEADDDVWRLTDKDIFKSLKLLLLSELNLKGWEASSDNFPNLKRLVLKKCKDLQEIPTDFGEICTLESIELHDCTTTAEDSARNIEQEREDMGYNILKVYIHNSHTY
ncbi:hypothetical protein MTR67_016162 [Solanum verrucosum]|uniref:NB-ARC domain-containing protein n=1 Tax=Solanum verrucosum TaxID=315347 RepID=A0AAF0TJF8_SOLVR|nr:hypothetical protein MTR67_016162 [Solanum verrucosum]